MEIEHIIRNVTLTKTEKHLEDYIMANINLFLEQSIQEFAKRADVATSLVTHYVKKIGYKDINHFRRTLLQAKVREEKIAPNELTFYVEKTNLLYFTSIEKTLRQLNIEALDKAISILKKTKVTFVYGLGTSRQIAQEMQNALLNIEFVSILANSIDDIVLYSQSYKYEDISVIIFSKNLDSPEFRFLLQAAEKFRFNLIIITQNYNIKATDNIAVVNFATVEQKNRRIALTSKINQMFIADIIVRKISNNKVWQPNELYEYFSQNWKAKKGNW